MNQFNYKDIFNNRFYLEIQRHNELEEKNYENFLNNDTNHI